jgi:hypothetical protein
MNCRSYKYNETNQELYRDEFAAINDLRVSNPSLFEMWPIPPLWKRGCDLRTHIDVPMHLLFLGTVKTVVRMIQAWCGPRGRTEYFIQHVFGVLESIEYLWLSLLHVVP